MAEAAAIFEGKPTDADDDGQEASEGAPNTLLQMVKKFINVREIDVDLIDSVNAFQERFQVALCAVAAARPVSQLCTHQLANQSNNWGKTSFCLYRGTC
ncbi:hypothetical protein [Aliiroseovarius sp. PrR006]|uniref:hypothetical protein n=1 Tax=Aliiroseovarius sp. PrR006 TaxID=2706883 RepID=UPI0013D54272|nr:hypothetical protein [Aliiroseovarius sp. PrR006]NDW53017.1 hypothetical protein [Aliiroseovarius sp. PrR006]